MCFLLFQSGTPFNIEPTTGVLRLTSALDFDVARSYALTITAEVSLPSVTEFRIVATYTIHKNPDYPLPSKHSRM